MDNQSEFEKWLHDEMSVGREGDEDAWCAGARCARDWILEKARENNDMMMLEGFSNDPEPAVYLSWLEELLK